MSVFIYILMIQKSHKPGYLQHSSSKEKGEKITCNHLTFAHCKQLRERGITSNFLCENAVLPLSLPQQWGCPWAEISSRAPLLSQGLCPAQAHEVVWVLVEGMWCEGVSSHVLAVGYGWVLRLRVLLQELAAPAGGGERGPRRAQVSSPALGRGWGDLPAGIQPTRAEPHPGK